MPYHPYKDQGGIIPEKRDIDAFEITRIDMNMNLQSTKFIRINKNVIFLCKSKDIKAYYEIGFIEKIEFINLEDYKGNKINTAIYFYTGTMNMVDKPYYVNLTNYEKLIIGWRYRKLWIQQNWFYTMAISILALALSIKIS